MTIAEVIQALRDCGLQDDAETNINEVRINRSEFVKVRAYGSREQAFSGLDYDEEDES